MLTREGRPWALIEAKQSETSPGPALGYFADRLGVKHRLLVVANLRESGTAGDLHVLDAPTFLMGLPV